MKITRKNGWLLTDDEVDQMVALWKQLDADEVIYNENSGVKLNKVEDSYFKDRIESTETWFLAEENGKVIGMVAIEEDDDYENANVVDRLVVNEEDRGFGIGKQLMLAAINDNEKNGKGTFVGVSVYNEAAQHLYESLGFVTTCNTMLRKCENPVKKGE